MLTGITDIGQTTGKLNSKVNPETISKSPSKKTSDRLEKPTAAKGTITSLPRKTGNKKITDYFAPLNQCTRGEGENDANGANDFVRQLQNSLRLTPTKKPQHHTFASNSGGSLTPSSMLSRRLATSLRLTASATKQPYKQLTIDEILEKCVHKPMELDDSLVTQVTPETALLSPSNLEIADNAEDVEVSNAETEATNFDNPFVSFNESNGKFLTFTIEDSSQVFTCSIVENENLENPFDDGLKLSAKHDKVGCIKRKIEYSVDKSISMCMRRLIENFSRFSPLVKQAGMQESGTEDKQAAFLLPAAISLVASEGNELQTTAQKKTLVLDLDETLIHCVSGNRPETYDFEFNVKFKGEILKFYCKLRPYLFHFLEHVRHRFEVIIFTASQQPYADALLDILDPKDEFFHHRLFRTACTFKDGFYVKNLERLGRPLEQVVIVDNSPQAFLYHLTNGIPIMSWFGDLQDRELLKLVGFLDDLHLHQGDSRDFLKQHFDWLR